MAVKLWVASETGAMIGPVDDHLKLVGTPQPPPPSAEPPEELGLPPPSAPAPELEPPPPSARAPELEPPLAPELEPAPDDELEAAPPLEAPPPLEPEPELDPPSEPALAPELELLPEPELPPPEPPLPPAAFASLPLPAAPGPPKLLFVVDEQSVTPTSIVRVAAANAIFIGFSCRRGPWRCRAAPWADPVFRAKGKDRIVKTGCAPQVTAAKGIWMSAGGTFNACLTWNPEAPGFRRKRFVANAKLAITESAACVPA
jgi:hypothetical protein